MQHKGTKRMETDRLLLRPFCMEDVNAAYKNWMSDEKVTKFLTWPTHTSLEISERVIKDWVSKGEQKDFYQLVIVLKELGEPIGSISVVDCNESLDILQIGYCIGSNWWHSGFTTEAFSAIIPYLFQEVGANRIEAKHDPHNPHSGNVMKKCGLQYEGTLRQAAFSNQGIVDVCMYGLLKSDWEKAKKE